MASFAKKVRLSIIAATKVARADITVKKSALFLILERLTLEIPTRSASFSVVYTDSVLSRQGEDQ